jgi:hypothetical protein
MLLITIEALNYFKIIIQIVNNKFLQQNIIKND